MRGTIAIHAAAKMHQHVDLPNLCRSPRPGELVLGAVIGLVDLVDVVEDHDSEWFQGPYGFVMRNPRPLRKPVYCKGMLGFWKVPPNAVRSVNRQLNCGI